MASKLQLNNSLTKNRKYGANKILFKNGQRRFLTIVNGEILTIFSYHVFLNLGNPIDPNKHPIFK